MVALAAATVACAALLFGAASAFALGEPDVNATTVAPSPWPSSVTVGQTLPLTLEVDNTSSGAGADGYMDVPITVTSITIYPSCSQFGSTCSTADLQTDVFSLSSTGSGDAGTACAGDNFTISAPDPVTGLITLTPTSPVVLAPVGQADDTCDIDFTATVENLPDNPPGVAQTWHILSAAGEGTNMAVPPVTAGGGDWSSGATVVAPAPTAVVTTPSGPVDLGGDISDTATLSGVFNPISTGTITFAVYGPGNPTCSGPPLLTSTMSASAGNGVYKLTPFVAPAAGTYYFVVSYSGDANNAASTSACGAESVTVFPPPSVTTNASAAVVLGKSISDSATLSGGQSPTGTITFTAYGPNDSSCSTAPAFTSTVGVTGDSTYSSASFTPTAAGTYRWIAVYSGDTNNPTAIPGGSIAAACAETVESVLVSPPPSVTTNASAAVTLGSPISDSATLSGGQSPTGTITFTAYGPNDSSCSTVAFTSTVNVSGDSTYSSASFTPTAAGTYRWIAVYNGDTNNPSAIPGGSIAAACAETAESVVVSSPPPPATTTTTTTTTSTATPAVTTSTTTTTTATSTAVTPAPTAIVTKASAAVKVGGSISDSATLSGGSSPTGTITFDIYGPNNATCSGTPVATSTATVSGNGAYSSTPFKPTKAGTYRFTASYSGNSANAASSSGCNAANESVKVSPKPKPKTSVKASTTPVPPTKPAVIHGPGAGCVAKTFQAYVTGTHISAVSFYLNSKKLGTVTKAGAGGHWAITVSSIGLPSNEYRIIARVLMSTGTKSKPTTKTQSATLIFYTCPKTVKPQFTG